MLLDILPNILTVIYNQLIYFMNSIIEWVAQQESYIFKDIPFDSIQLVLSYILIFTLVYSLIQKKFKNILEAALCIIVFQLWLISSTVKKGREQKIIVLHKTGTSALLYKKGNYLDVNCLDSVAILNLVKNIVVVEKIQKINHKTLKNSYQIKDQSLLILNEPEIIYQKFLKTDFVILGNSPKINLNRFLDSMKPKSIIADGSNYRSDIQRWKKSCSNRKLPFYYTGEKGALMLEIE